MTSQRKRKKDAASRGLTTTELDLVELLEEILDSVKWLQVLGYTNQYLVEHKLDVPQDERDKVVEAAARTVERDRQLQGWFERLGDIKHRVARVHPQIAKSRRQIQAEQRKGGGAAAADGDG